MARTKRNAARTPGEPSQVRNARNRKKRDEKRKNTSRGRILQRARHLSLPEKKRKAFAPANFHLLLNLTVGMKRRRGKKRSVPSHVSVSSVPFQ